MTSGPPSHVVSLIVLLIRRTWTDRIEREKETFNEKKSSPKKPQFQ